MPLPTPRKNEEKQHFISRCIRIEATNEKDPKKRKKKMKQYAAISSFYSFLERFLVDSRNTFTADCLGNDNFGVKTGVFGDNAVGVHRKIVCVLREGCPA